MSVIGPNFAAELRAAGLDPAVIPFAWDTETGQLIGTLTPEQLAIFDAVLAAHNPATKTVDQARLDDFLADPDVRDIINRVKSNDLATIKTYLAANINTLAEAKPWLIKALLLLAVLAQKYREFG